MIRTNKTNPTIKIERETIMYMNCQWFKKHTHSQPNEQIFPSQVVMQVPKLKHNSHNAPIW